MTSNSKGARLATEIIPDPYSTLCWRQDVALRYEPAAAAVPAASSPAPETVPPPLVAAVLLVNSTRCRLLHKSPSTQFTLRGLSLFIAEAEGAFPE